jgi:hypothetical protein
MMQYQNILEFNGETKLPAAWWQEFGSTPSAERYKTNKKYFFYFLFFDFLKFKVLLPVGLE